VVEAKAFKDDGSGQRSTNPSEKIVNTYDSWGRLVKVVAWKEDSGGTLRAMTRTEYTYDNLNRVTRTIVLEKDTDSPTASDYLAVTRSLYDELGRVYEAQGVNPAADIDDPTDAAAVNGYVFHDEYGRVWKTRDDEGNETVRTYDTAGRAVQAEDAAGNKVSYSYDAASRVWCVKSEEKVATGVYDTSYVYTWYDDEGRVVATADYGVKTSGHPISYSTYAATNPATLVSDADKRVVRYGYGFDATEGKEYVETTGYQGDATTPTAVTTRSYSDKLGRTVRADEDRTNLSRVTTYAFDKAGHLVAMAAEDVDGTTGDDQVTYYYHNARGQTTKVAYPDNDDETFVFDSFSGRMLSRTDQNGSTIAYEQYSHSGSAGEPYRYMMIEKATAVGSGVWTLLRPCPRSATGWGVRRSFGPSATTTWTTPTRPRLLSARTSGSIRSSRSSSLWATCRTAWTGSSTTPMRPTTCRATTRTWANSARCTIRTAACRGPL